MDKLDEESSLDLREYLGVLRSHKLLIFLTTLLCVGAAVGLSARQTPLYKGSARVVIEAIAADPENPPWLPPNMETERERAASVPVASLVVDELEMTVSPEELLVHLDVAASPQSEVLTISYTSPDPEEAADVANAFAASYLSYRQTTAEEKLTAALAGIRQRISSVEERLSEIQRELETGNDPAEAGGDRTASESEEALLAEETMLLARLGVLQQRLDDLSAGTIQARGGEVIAPAQVPTRPASPNYRVNGTLGLLLGLFLGIGFAFLRERLDNRFRAREDVERVLGIPVLGAIPKFKTSKKRLSTLPMIRDPNGRPAEAYRGLGTTVQFLASQRNAKSILVTSASAGEGKTITACNLAVSLAQAGRSVILISADLRRPVLDQRFDIKSDFGLAEWLQRSAAPAGTLLQESGVRGLRIVPAGRLSTNPVELLSSRKLGQIFMEFEKLVDWVIVDSPPVLPVADATIIGSAIGSAVLVVDVANTTRSAASHAQTELERVGTSLIGVVLNAVERKQRRYGYGYGYYDRYDYRYSRDVAADTQGGGNGSRMRRRQKAATKP